MRSRKSILKREFDVDFFSFSVFMVKVVPPWYNNEPPHEPEIIYTSPPKGHPSEYLYGAPPPPLHQHIPQDWETSGPGLGSE